ncbi:single-stranded-DNA-specific exonuclease RecJ [Hyphomicrobium sp. CS1BSMeth3]|uniref:single-stranded-DNA-specific exonuclease RecJ n=1 Tax=Hyphomicrobium sp. CS1BSMeth3 TaxID=1892844 RepID=UPI00092FD9F2|nr:single-stranded-DNA-specific exonuclease RecJ [Hyphomicrobium sp. CS1BSMeth3]
MATGAARVRPRERGSSDAQAYLGVTASARGYTWRERLAPGAANTAIAISQQHGLPELLGRVLAARGITIEEVPNVLEPTIRALMPDPSTLNDMDKAARRLADAIVKRERVAVFGDYDVDGACSSALMRRFFNAHGLDATIYIPDRMFEGYGPNVPAIQGLVEKGAQLIVTVDCGTTSFEALAPQHRGKTDVLVIDHHQADEQLPEVSAVVNPNRQDDLSGLGHLCAAGVVFMLLVATTRELRQRGHYDKNGRPPDLLAMLDLVALATVCDVVPLQTLNRAYVTRGLEVMRQRQNVGLRALVDAAGLNQPPTPYLLGFVLGPRINAGGRIGDAALGARLLSLDDETEAARIAVQLDKLNRERKAIETAMLEEATAEADRLIDEVPDLPMLVVASERWHKGVVGLVASRLVERFGRPACVIAWEEGGQGTGSLRSIAGVDIGAAVRAATADGLLLKGGGHAMAAGLTVVREKFEAARTYLAEQVASPATTARVARALEIDGALTPAAANDTLVDLIERAGPYGQGNPQPRFVFPAHRVRFAKVMGEAHLRVTLEADDGSRLEGVAFRAVGQPLGEMLTNTGGMPIHVAGNLRRDTWGGRQRIELQIEDAADPRK